MNTPKYFHDLRRRTCGGKCKKLSATKSYLPLLSARHVTTRTRHRARALNLESCVLELDITHCRFPKPQLIIFRALISILQPEFQKFPSVQAQEQPKHEHTYLFYWTFISSFIDQFRDLRPLLDQRSTLGTNYSILGDQMSIQNCWAKGVWPPAENIEDVSRRRSRFP